MQLYRITIRGKHETLICQTFYGLALRIDQAMSLAMEAARKMGWESPRVDSADTIAPLAFDAAATQDQEAGQ
ncbi:MAG: hypothetical protein ACYS74_17790 [Planctomycetota bacterium]|jgi:hypothetical protein